MAVTDPIVGQTLGHYQVLAKIGAGGMGEVYRARDQHLEREVAIKVLPPGALADEAARKRFRSEALALSRLNHPNIATIFDFDTQQGVDFLAMEYIPGATVGDTLREGPLAEKEVARLGVQLAEGLAAAHAEGVIHRDLKPANLRVSQDGRLKILDFGLAKLLATSTDLGPTASFSRTHGVAGTLPYMAPEQLRGEKVDGRTDIWGAGCVLYEMATGKQPFSGQTGPQITDSVLRQPPVVPRALNAQSSPALEGVILKCLEKDPDNRYQSARELAVDLRRLGSTALTSTAVVAPPRPRSRRLLPWGAGAVLLFLLALGAWWGLGWKWKRVAGTRIQSLAVLPFENLSGDAREQFFVEGIHEELTSQLAQIGALKVISRTSTMSYRETRKPLPEIARELGVDAVIEGSVRLSGGQVRITVQLIRAATDEHLWAESYQREMRDILGLQSEVAQAIARQVRVAITPAEASRLASSHPVNPEAHELYLRGRYYWNQRTQEGFDASIRYYEQALEKDPLYAKAYAGLADSYLELANWGRQSPGATMPKAKAAALKALELDPSLAEAHASLCNVAGGYEWDWATAERECRRAIELSPGYGYAHFSLGTLLRGLKRQDEALREVRLAQQLDPLSSSIAVEVGFTYRTARRYDEAIQQFQTVLALHPDDLIAKFALGVVLTDKGRYDEAIQVFLSRKVPTAGTNWALGYAYGLAGKRKEAQAVLQYLQERAKAGYVPPVLIAIVQIGLGNRDQAFLWMEKAYQDRDVFLTEMQVSRWFDGIRTDPRFDNLLRRMNFPP